MALMVFADVKYITCGILVNEIGFDAFPVIAQQTMVLGTNPQALFAVFYQTVDGVQVL